MSTAVGQRAFRGPVSSESIASLPRLAPNGSCGLALARAGGPPPEPRRRPPARRRACRIVGGEGDGLGLDVPVAAECGGHIRRCPHRVRRAVGHSGSGV